MEGQRKTYVLGFLFDKASYCMASRVALIWKKKPAWQAGRLNGVGGLVEPGETPLEAMSREFMEETGHAVPAAAWCNFAKLECPGYDMEVFYSVATSLVLDKLESPTEEEVEDVWAASLGDPGSRFFQASLPNVPWLVHMAISFERGEKAKKLIVKEEH